MPRALVVVLLVIGVCVLLLLAQSDSGKARAELNLGVQAYKQAKYEAAIQHFKQAASLDPTLINARLYLATTYAQMVVPGDGGEQNKRAAETAINEFQRVLEMDPDQEQRLSALRGIASLYYNLGELDKAKEYQRKITEAIPNDAEAYFTIGVIDWTQAYKPRMEARAKLGLKPDEPLTDPAMCAEIRAANQDKVKEGMEVLAKALELRPDYDDAMAYMNLMYRERADIQCGDPAARAADLEKADEWVNITLAMKKRKAEQQKSAVPPK